MSGCATIPRTAGPSAVSSALQDQVINLNNTNYVPLVVVCDRFDFKWSWDTVARKAGIQNKNFYVRFMEGSNFALLNDNPRRMEGPAVLYQGALMVPVSFVQEELLPPQLKVQEYAPPKAAGLARGLTGKVVIDPGHGGKDPGAIGRVGLREKDVVLQIAKGVGKKLEAAGLDVYLTRSDDRFISLAKRSQIANDCRADLFISIHANAARVKNARGFEVYYLAEAADESAKHIAKAENACLRFEQSSYKVNSSGDLESILWDLVSTENRAESIQLANRISKEARKTLWIRQRGVKSGQFYVLKGARMPALLVEVGFITNADEEEKLRDPSYRENVANAIVNGIADYWGEYNEK